MDPSTHDAPTAAASTAAASTLSTSAPAPAATTPNARTPATRTVGFAIPKLEQSPGTATRDDGHVSRELKALRAAAEGAAHVPPGVVASPSAAPSAGSGQESNGIAIPSAGLSADAPVGSREPVMIMPPRAAQSGGGAGAKVKTEPVKGASASGGEREVDALTRELARGASTRDGGRAPETAAAADDAMVGGGDANVVGESATETKEKVVKAHNGPPRDLPPPKPKMTKAERRELQEKQRAAKASAKDGDGGGGASGGSGGAKKVEKSSGDAASVSGGDKKALAAASDGSSKKKSEGRASTTSSSTSPRSVLKESVSHLRTVNKCYIPNASSLHPAVERLAVDYARGTTSGARERVYSLLRVLRSVVETFEVPTGTTYAHALTSHLNQVVHVLDKARPMGIAMGNAVRSLKTHLARMSHEEGQHGGGAGDEDYRGKTLMHIDYFIREKLDTALESIVKAGVGLIEHGDVVVTHGASQAVSAILIKARDSGVKFSVVVVDSRPSCEGAKILRHLSAHGVDCTFTALNGLSYAMRHATKVLVGAAACMGNGVVLSRVGSSAVAHAACARKIPVYVAAETCKFHERVQLDATVFNELGCDDDVVRLRPGVDGVLASRPANLTIFNVTYDAVPAACVDAIICEAGAITPADVLCYVLHS